MATTLYFTNTLPDYSTGHNDADLVGTNVAWSPNALDTSRGSAAVSSARTSVTGPTVGIEVGATALVWYSEPLGADVTISGSITWNLRAAEAAMAANAAVNAILEVVDGATGAFTTIDQTARSTELGTSEAAANFSETPASGVACKRGDRLRVRVFFDDGGGTMASGSALTFWFNGPTAAASGDSYFTLTETLTFEDTPGTTQIFLTDTASDVSTASVDKEAWTSRGAGVQTKATDTQLGWVSPIQMTDGAGGTPIDWFTKPLQAVTIGGATRINLGAFESNTSANVTGRCEIAVVDGDGTNPVVWAASTFPSEWGTSEGFDVWLISGDDLDVEDGQRLRIRFYLDNVPALAMVNGHTGSIRYAGTSGGASGDTYLMFNVALTEFVAQDSIKKELLYPRGAVHRAAGW